MEKVGEGEERYREFVIGDYGHITVEEIVYHIGYFGTEKSVALYQASNNLLDELE